MEICKKNVFFIYLGVLIFLSFQVSNFSSAIDTITTDQPLSGSRTIVSRGDVFELGFFEENTGFYNRSAYYLGMWYKQVSPTQTIVWVANREYPVRGISSSYLMISSGNLILLNNLTHKTIWSTGLSSTRSSKDVQAVLLDNGNLVLKDGLDVLWQSFDHPTDTWLPEAKLKLGSPLLTSWKSEKDPSPGRYSLEVDPKTNSLVAVWNGSKSYWSSGPWDDRRKTFMDFPYIGTGLSLELNPDESYINYSVTYNSLSRLVMDVSGLLIQYSWVNDYQVWDIIGSSPRAKCEVYNYCGSFEICKESQKVPCTCVPRFRKALTAETYMTNFHGCKRKTKLQCDVKGNNTFLAIANMKLATDPTITFVLTDVATCASACLPSCSCEAYAYDGENCLMWTTNAFNLKQLDGNRSKGDTFFLKVAAPKISTAAPNVLPAPFTTRKHAGCD